MIRLATGFLFSFAVALTPISVSRAEDGDYCPAAKSFTGAVKSGPYSFKYKSWQWEEDSKFPICHCVRNATSAPRTSIDWDGAGLNSPVDPGEEIYVYQSHEKDGHHPKAKTLWYGTAFVPIQAETIFPGSQNKTELEINSVKLISNSNENSRQHQDSAEAKNTEVRGKIFVPSADIENKHFDSSRDFSEYIETNNEIKLQPFRMGFTSQTTSDDSGLIVGIAVQCAYLYSVPVTGYAIRMSNRNLQAALFGDRETVALGDWRFENAKPIGELGVEFQGFRSIAPTQPDKLVLKTATMDIVLSNQPDVTIGSMAISYYDSAE